MSRSFSYIIYICVVALLTGCVDKFDAELSSQETRILTVEGSILSDHDCSFSLTHTVGLGELILSEDQYRVTDASVSVHGSDGQVWQGQLNADRRYVVPVGTLQADAKYWLEVEWEGDRYASEPLTPLATTPISDVEWDCPANSGRVDVLVSATVPDHSASQPRYFRWSFTETWKITTPLHAVHTYNPETDEIEVTQVHLEKGWKYNNYTTSSFCSNEDYGYGDITRHRICQYETQDERFNTRLLVRVSQVSITQEEYEYEKLSATLSNEMGGLFTPQPSALPSNVTCQTSNRQVIGYIGVHLNASTADLYIDRLDVGHTDTRQPVLLADEEAVAMTWRECYDLGWRVASYNPYNQPIVVWCAKWCIDCREWGATLTRPDYWID